MQTNDPTTKIQWLKKIDIQQLFRPDAIVFGSEQYENIEQSQGPQLQQYSNNILSKPLVFSQVTIKEDGQYICLIQNDKATNYKKAFINVIDYRKGKKSDVELYLKYERLNLKKFTRTIISNKIRPRIELIIGILIHKVSSH